MKTLNLKIILLLTIFYSTVAYNQKCNDFFKSDVFNKALSKGFIDYGQSKVVNIEVNKTYNFEIVFSGREEYLVKIVTENDYGQVNFRIINSDNNIILYDNKKYNYKSTANFYIEETQNINIEVTLIIDEKHHSVPVDQGVCLGIKINNRHFTE